MNLALVKLEHSGKSYLFEFPPALYRDLYMNMGVRVLCEAGNKIELGELVGFIKSADVVETSDPIRQIVAVEREVSVSNITIPYKFECAPPKDEKIAKRFLEYYHHGHFNTNIILSTADRRLVDGYSAYLVAKAMDLPALKCFVVNNITTLNSKNLEVFA